MHWRSWLCRAGDLLVITGYAVLLAHVWRTNEPCAPCSLHDPELWSKADLIGLFDFCSRENPWPRPTLSNLTHTAVRATPELPNLHRTYRLANKAWGNQPNAARRTKFTSEEVVLLDGFDASASDVESFMDANSGTIVLGYISAGSFEDWRSDAGKWPDACIGPEYFGWAGENWLPPESWQRIKPVMLARLKMLRDKGFSGVEFDNIALLDQFDDNETRKHYRSATLAYAEWLADSAHGFGLLAVAKNAPYLSDKFADFFDAVIVESALEYNEVHAYAPYAERKKPIWLFEYNGSLDSIAQKARDAKITVSDVLIEKNSGWKHAL